MYRLADAKEVPLSWAGAPSTVGGQDVRYHHASPGTPMRAGRDRRRHHLITPRPDRPEPRILLFAHNMDPARGSEEAVGWTWARMLGGIGECWVLIRDHPARVDSVTRSLAHIPEGPRIHLIPVAVPRWLDIMVERRLPPGARYLAYMAWQVLALRRARQLVRSNRIDIVWHVTWSTAWLGSLAWSLELPFAWGPISGGVTPPWRLVRGLGARLLVTEAWRRAVQLAGRYLNPLARRSWQRASLVLVQNRETAAWLPNAIGAHSVVMPNTVLEDDTVLSGRPDSASRSGGDTVLFAGRLLPWKGAAIAIRVIASLPESRLVICGEGPEHEHLVRLAAALGVTERVEFRGQLARRTLRALMLDEADVLIVPSIREEGGFVVVEALACGLPVVCLDRGGPARWGATTVRPTDLTETVGALARAVAERRPWPPDAIAPTIFSIRPHVRRLMAEAGLLGTSPDQGAAD